MQAALGAVVVLATSTLNRVMVVELALPAMLPGALVALHYGVQVLRPRLGYGSDMGGRRTPWIVGGMAALAAGRRGRGLRHGADGGAPAAGVLLAVAAFALVGLGVGAAGTSLLTLMAPRVDPRRRAPAATVLWLLMIAGIVLTAGVASRLLDPFSPGRLVAVTPAWPRSRSPWPCSRCGGSRARPAAPAAGRHAAGFAGAARGVGGAAGAPLRRVRVRLHAGLQRAGAGAGAVRRRRVRAHAGPDAPG